MNWGEFLGSLIVSVGIGAVLAAYIGARAGIKTAREQLEQQRDLSDRTIEELRRKGAWEVFVPFLIKSPRRLKKLETTMRSLGCQKWSNLVERCLDASDSSVETGLERRARKEVKQLARTFHRCIPALAGGDLTTSLQHLQDSLREYTHYFATKIPGQTVSHEDVLRLAGLVDEDIGRTADKIYDFLSRGATAPPPPTGRSAP